MIYQADTIKMDTDTRQVWSAGKEIHVTRLEFDLLVYLVAEPYRVREYDEILRDVWGYDSPNETRTLASFAARLRRKIGNPKAFSSRHGFGVSLLPPPASAAREMVAEHGPYRTRAEMRERMPVNTSWPHPDYRINIAVPRSMASDDRERWVRAAVSAAGTRGWVRSQRERLKDAGVLVHDGEGVSVQIDTVSLQMAA